MLVTPPADTTAPTVTITTPAETATVSGTTTLSAAATDFTGVTGVQFRLDGANLGAELTSAPYAWNWNTTTTPDGVHVLGAVARDAAGNTTTAVQIAVTVLNTPIAPQISGVNASGVKQTRALIGWTTNQLADSQVEYGLTTAYGSATVLDPARASAHLQLLSGLTGGTTYHYRVSSHNAQNLAATSGDFTFTTAAAPVITAVGTSSVTPSSAWISWTTNIASSSLVEYGLTTDYSDATELDPAFVTAHGMTLSGLARGATYHFRVHSISAADVVSISGDFTFTTVTNPALSNIGPTALTQASARIGWTSDQPATSRLEFGPTTAYGQITSLDPALVSAHSQTLTGIAAGTTYHYRVISTNVFGLSTTSDDATFTSRTVQGVVW
jgi:hypothetical protein